MSDELSGYSVTVTRTLKMAGRFHNAESAEQFVRDLTAPGTGHVSPLEWDTAVTVEPLATAEKAGDGDE